MSPIVNLHVHYDRRVLDEPLRGRGGDVAAAVAVRPHRVVRASRRASSCPSRSRARPPRSASRSRRCASATCPRSSGCCPNARGAEVLDFTATREPRATFRGAPGHRARCGPARARASPASTSPARGRTPAGPRRWRARCAAALAAARGRARRSRARQAGRRRAHGGRGVSVDRRRRRLDAAQQALERGARRTCSRSSTADGWWKGELETNVTIDAEDLFLRHYLGILDARADGGDRALDPLEAARRRELGDVLRRPGRPLDDGRGVRRAAARRRPRRTPSTCAARRRCVRDARRRRAHARLHAHVAVAALALVVGATCPALPPEQILLPAARAALDLLVRLLGAADDRRALDRVGAASRASRVPFGDRRAADGRDDRDAERRRGRARSPRSTAALHRYERRPIAPLRRRALRAAERWIVERQEADGSWGGIQPPWVWSIIALHALGYGLDHPVIVAARSRASTASRSRTTPDAGSRRASRRSGTRRSRCSRSLDAGFAPTHDAVARGARVARRPRGARARRLGGAAAGPRARRLPVRVRERQLPRRRRHGGRRARAAARRRSTTRARPTAASRGRSGCSRATAAGRRSTSTTRAALPAKLPFCDFGAVTDPPSADVTAHMVEMLAHEGRADDDETRARHRMAAARAGARRLVVRPLGREPRLRHRRRGARRSRPAGSRGHESVRARGRAGSSACRTTTAASARTSARTATRAGAAAAPRRPRRRRGRCSRSTRRARPGRPSSAPFAGSSTRSAATAAGTSRSSPAPASRATSTSTTTSTGRSSR